MAYHEIRRMRVSASELPAGGTVRIQCEVYDADGALTTPGTTKRVRIYSRTANAEVTSSPFTLTADATGLLSYNYTTLTTRPHSAYDLRFETNDGTHDAVADFPNAFKTVPL